MVYRIEGFKYDHNCLEEKCTFNYLSFVSLKCHYQDRKVVLKKMLWMYYVLLFYFFSLRLWPKLWPHSPQSPFSFSIPSEEARAAMQEATQSVGPFWPYSFHGGLPAHPWDTRSDLSSHAE